MRILQSARSFFITGVLSFAACGGGGFGGEGDAEGEGESESGGDASGCPADEELTTDDIEPYFACVDEGPCGSLFGVWDFSPGGGFTESIAGYEDVAECWFTELGKGTTGRYRIDSDFFDEPGYNTYDVFEGRMLERRQVDMTANGLEVQRGPRNLASADYFAACRAQWDGGEFLPQCFWDGFTQCTAWGTPAQACGDEPGGGTGEDPPIDEPIPWPDGGQYSGPCSSIGDCVGFSFGQSITCDAETKTCTSGCIDASECDPAPEGDAVPVCVGGGLGQCRLDCSSGQTCPTGMSCASGVCGW